MNIICHLETWNIFSTACIWSGALIFMLSTASISTLVVMSVMRYIKMCHSKSGQSYNGHFYPNFNEVEIESYLNYRSFANGPGMVHMLIMLINIFYFVSCYC